MPIQPSNTVAVLGWLLGLPRRLASGPAPRPGPVTWTVLVGCAVGTAVLAIDPQLIRLAFDTGHPLRGFATPVLISFVFHSGFFHLICNGAYLLLFGPAVEREIGPWRFVALLALSDLAGNAAHITLVGDGAVLIGASAGVSGALAAWVMLNPHEEIEVPTSWFLPTALGGRFWIPLRAPWLLVVTLAWQFVGMQLELGDVAYAAHVGGMAAGAALALGWRQSL